MRTLLTWGLFPALFLTTQTLGLLGVQAGLPQVWLLIGLLVSTALLLTLLERVHAHVPDWNRFRGDFQADTGHLVTSILMVPELLNVLLFGGLAAAGLAAADASDWGVWPAHWPLLAQWALAMVLAEFGQYWAHRWAHEWEPLWRLHATHHSVSRLWWYNAGRFHPLDTAVQYTAQMLCLLPLGCPAEVVLLFTLFTGVHGMCQHTNIRMRLGPLNYVFSMAELHRWHHSRVLTESNANYGANLILWDLVFGTFSWPRDREASPDIGLVGLSAFPTRWLPQLASPFTWRRIQAASALDSAESDDSAP